MSRGIRSTRREVPMSKTLVTYNVDVGESYQEKVSYKKTVLSPTTFTPTKAGWAFLGWKETGIASGDVLVDKVATGKTMTLYAVFEKDITVTYYNASATASTTSKKQYYNNADILDPTFNLTQASVTNWSPRGWTKAASGGSSAIAYANATNFQVNSNTTIYGCYQRTVTIKYNGNGQTGGSTANSTGTAYYHSKSGTTNASITVRSCTYTKTSYTFYRWRLNSASSATLYSAGSTYSSTADCTMYAYWVQSTNATYNYTGGMQGGYTALAGITYQVQLYGAQGGGDSEIAGANGGYTLGYRKPSSNETWYIGVGGNAATFNGGGAGRQTDGGMGKNGGGGSHIGLSNAQISGTAAGNLIAAAGGGGGCGYYFDGSIRSTPGAGGGTTGGSSSIWYNSSSSGGGQSGGGQWGGSYGQGGSAYAGNAGGGGGGGYYGGGGGDVNSGSGGSGTTRGLTSASMSNGQKSGNGQVIIKVYSVA